MQNRVVVVGSYNTDMVIRTSRIPRPGETVIGGSFTRGHGGKGANQAVAAARAGARVTFVGSVGADVLGEEAIASLQTEGINTGSMHRDAGAPTGTAWIIVDSGGENSIVVASGANALLTEKHIVAAEAAISTAAVLLVQLECPLPAVRAAISCAASHHVPVVLNPAPAVPLENDLLRSVSILTPNEVEAEMLTGIPLTDDRHLSKAADVLLERGVGAALITLGARGAYLATEGTREIVPSFAVKPVDTTAAGDVFNGVLAAFLAANRPLMDAVSAASAGGALCVTRAGAQQSIPSLSEILAFLDAGVHQPL